MIFNVLNYAPFLTSHPPLGSLKFQFFTLVCQRAARQLPAVLWKRTVKYSRVRVKDETAAALGHSLLLDIHLVLICCDVLRLQLDSPGLSDSDMTCAAV